MKEKISYPPKKNKNDTQNSIVVKKNIILSINKHNQDLNKREIFQNSDFNKIKRLLNHSRLSIQKRFGAEELLQ